VSRHREKLGAQSRGIGSARGSLRALSCPPLSHFPVRSAFTLVEVTLSIAITSILLLGMGGALLLTVSAVDAGDDGSGRANAAAESLSSMSAELSVATNITSFDSHDIAFTVPDRDGDGRPEAIEYTWYKSGDPMLRSYNGGRPATYVSAVKSCTPVLVERPAAQPVESAEQILAQCDTVAGSTSKISSVDDTNLLAQYIRPVLPAGAVSWKITRARVYAYKNSGNSDPMHISVCTAGAALTPKLPVLGFTTFTGPSLGNSPGWHEFLIGPVANLAPSQGVCIVLDGNGGNGSANVAYLQGGTAQPFNTHMTLSTNSGSTWSSPDDSRDMRFILMGTYTTMVEP
jgi:hypothetical protein